VVEDYGDVFYHWCVSVQCRTDGNGFVYVHSHIVLLALVVFLRSGVSSQHANCPWSLFVFFYIGHDYIVC